MSRLRTGFSTGTYATATALAAWRSLHGRRNGKQLGILFPDGRSRRVNLDGWEATKHGARAWATKDAGDDIDITDKALIKTEIRTIEPKDVKNSDYVEKCGKTNLVIRAGKGVGQSTRRGLDVPVGKWAINPVPRKMIVDNIKQAGAHNRKEMLLVEIGISNGTRLAKKTLNPMLGIENGLSILGTSGLVIPCSNSAYIATIEVLVRGAAECGCKSVVLVTGGKTHKIARKMFPTLDEISFIRIGDFIKESIDACSEQGIKKVNVVCMPGKLAKYAQGHAYTHAHTVAQSMKAVADILSSTGYPDSTINKCRDSRSVREFLEHLPKKEQSAVIKTMKELALTELRNWSSKSKIEISVIEHERTI